MTVKLLGYSTYSFPNKETGEIIEGAKCHFNDITTYENFKGTKVFTKSISSLKQNKTPLIIDGIYDLNFNIDITKNTVSVDSITLKK